MDGNRASDSAHIMRYAYSWIVNLPLVRLVSELLGELVDLRNAGRADRMPFCLQSPRHIHRKIPVKLGAAFSDKLLALPFFAKSKVLIGHELHRSEGVMQLDAVNVLRGDPRFPVCLSCAKLCRFPARHVRSLECWQAVCAKRGSCDLDIGLLLGDDRSSSPIDGNAAIEEPY